MFLGCLDLTFLDLTIIVIMTVINIIMTDTIFTSGEFFARNFKSVSGISLFKTLFSPFLPGQDKLLIARINPTNNYLLKVNNRNARTTCEICSELKIKTLYNFIVNSEHISHLVLVFLSLTLSK